MMARYTLTIYKLLYTAALALPLLLAACAGNNSGGGVPEGSNKFKQYYIAGAELYTRHCSNCHRPDGKGLGLVYPPLDTSDYMEAHVNDVMHLMRYGRAGEMVVNGKRFNKIMPGNAALTNIEVAEIATYIYNTWSHQRGLIAVREAAAVLDTARAPVQGSR